MLSSPITPNPPKPSHDNRGWSPYLGLHKDEYRFSAFQFFLQGILDTFTHGQNQSEPE